MKSHCKRTLAFLLTLVMLCSAFTSCDKLLANTPDASDTLATDDNGKVDEGTIGSESGDDEDDDETESGTKKNAIPIFSNGEYTAKIICSDKATAFEKNMYNKIRELLKKHTGVTPPADTDYVASGTEKYSGPAILIGETSYSQSKTAYKKLGYEQATATILSNKYVIAANSEEMFEELLIALKKNLTNRATKDEIVIDSRWKIDVSSGYISSGNETFDETGLIKSATPPNLGTSYNSGQNSKTYIKNNATKSTFETLCKDIEAKGFKKYTSNSIGNNLFATYITQTQIVHVMFFPNKSQIRTSLDTRGEGMNGFSLTGLSGENRYKPTTDSKMILCDISNADWPGGMCLIFKLADGRFFIVDAGIGGYISDGRSNKGSSSGWIYQTLAAHADDPKNIEVAAWLITHVHSDHAGGLYDMALGYYGYNGSKHTVMPKEMKQYIKIDKIIYNAPDNFPDCNREGWMKKIIEGFNVKNVVKAHPGQVFYLADLTLTIYGSLDVMIENASKSSDLNDFSIVSRAEFNGKSMLITGDTDTIPNPVLAAIYKESLKSDILQMSHHGYGDTGDGTLNSYCNPEITIWPVSKADQRSNYNINLNNDISSQSTSNLTVKYYNSKGTCYGNLNSGKNYRPGMGNLVFDQNWNPTEMKRSDILAAIPTCDGTHCGNSNCSKKSSNNLYVET